MDLQTLINGDSNLLFRTKLNGMLQALITGTEGVNAIWAKIRTLISEDETLQGSIDSLATDLSNQLNDANDYTDTKVEALKAIINSIDGNFYGFYPNSTSLPTGTVTGYAYVAKATTDEYAIWNYIGSTLHWVDSGLTKITSDSIAPLIVNLTNTSGTYTADKTFAEIIAAFATRALIVFKYNNGTDTITEWIVSKTASTNSVVVAYNNYSKLTYQNTTITIKYVDATGKDLTDVVSSVTAFLGGTYTFKGIAIPTTTPGTPDGNLFYIATEKGTYTNFGGLVVAATDGMVIFTYNGVWSKNNIPVALYKDIENFKTYENIDIASIVDSGFLQLDGSIGVNSSYEVYIYPVTPGDKYRIIGEMKGNVSLINAYSSNIINATTFKKCLKSSFGDNYYNEEILIPNIPEGIKYVAITSYKEVSEFKKFKLYDSNIIYSTECYNKLKDLLQIEKLRAIDKEDLIDEKINSLSILEKYTKLQTDSIINHEFQNTGGNTVMSDDYSIAMYAVDDNKKYKIKGKSKGIVFIVEAYNNIIPSTTSFIADIETDFNSALKDLDIEISIPVGTTYIGVTRYITNISNYELLSLYEKVVLNTKDVLVSQINNLKKIVCWGDSLTYGYGAKETGGLPYTDILNDLLGYDYTVYNAGISGDSVQNIRARMGSSPALIPTNISLSATPWEASSLPQFINAEGQNITIGTQGMPDTQGINLVNPIYIRGKMLWQNWSNNTPTLCQWTNIDGVLSLKENESLIFNGTKDFKESFCTILFVGTNGGWDDFTKLMEYYDEMISFCSSSKILIIGLTSVGTDSRNSLAQRINQETLMTSKYGLRYINLRKYFVERGLEDAKINPTTEDNLAISLGKIPPSLLYDGLHYNSIGYRLLGNLIYNRGINIGYWI